DKRGHRYAERRQGAGGIRQLSAVVDDRHDRGPPRAGAATPGRGRAGVNFLPEYKALHDAGYNVLAYDIRNHGMSGHFNGGIAGIGLTEYRDVIGSLRYAATRPNSGSRLDGRRLVQAPGGVLRDSGHGDAAAGLRALHPVQDIYVAIPVAEKSQPSAA